MDAPTKKPRPERDETDESLRTERSKADRALIERRATSEVSEDQVVERAREHADAVLDTARDKADLKRESIGGPGARDSIVRERELEDHVLEDERAAADERLHREREEHVRSLASLLPLERENTDRRLLTERVRSDDALAQRDDFMGMVSHDLRNLLSGIVLEATQLTKEASESDEGRRTIASMNRVQRYVARMNRLIGDLVDVVSIDAGKLAVHATGSDAAALIREAVDAFARSASEKGLSLLHELAAPTISAELDHDRMLQVLANLITNALKFTPHGGKIVVRGERVGHELRLSVSDDGVGIPEHMHEAVFERFWQVGKNDKRGLGLGLYISRCIVAAHGGRIWAESQLGEGSVFHVLIPATARR